MVKFALESMDLHMKSFKMSSISKVGRVEFDNNFMRRNTIEDLKGMKPGWTPCEIQFGNLLQP